MDTIAVTNGRIVDGTGAEPIEDGTAVISDGEFQAVGPAGEVDIPSDAVEVDASGRTVMPGLIEGHAHVGGGPSNQRDLRLSLQRGITTVCSVSANEDGLPLRDGIESGVLRGCAELVAGAMVAPTNGHVRFRDADGPWEVRKAVREMVEMGADFIKTCATGGFADRHEPITVRNYTLEELEALSDEAHAWDVPVVVHAHTQPGINNSIEAGIDQIHHGALIDEEGVRNMLENGSYFIPTLAVTSGPNIDAHPPWMIDEMRETATVHREGTGLAVDLGVKIGVGTDYVGRDVWNVGDKTMWELQELVALGMTPLEAIHAGTQVTAEAFQIDDRTGTLEAGKQADLVIVDDNPVEDIRCLMDGENIRFVMKYGDVQFAEREYLEYYSLRDREPQDRLDAGRPGNMDLDL